MSNLSHYIIEDVNSLYSSIYLSEETEVDEIDAFAGDVYAFVAHSMLHEGYSASGILGFLSTASEDEILEKFGDYNENFISESTISEEYVNEQVEQLDEFVGAALRVLGAGAKAAKFAKGATGLAPLSRMGAGLKGAGQALSRVAKQGPRASSVVRAGLSKVKNVASAGLSKLKGAATKVGGAVKGAVTKAAPAIKGALKGAAKMALPAAAGFALGRATAPKGETSKPSTPNPSGPKSTSQSGSGTQRPTSTPKPAAPQKSARQQEVDSINADKSLTPMQKWAKANPKLAAAKAERDRTRGTSATTNPMLQDIKSSMPAPKPKEETKKESYDIVLDYLLSEGHADTVEEAHYIMLRLEADHVQEIVESYS